MFKIATWNVNSLRVRLTHVLDWLESESPDVLALQETKITDEVFPVREFNEIGYQAVYSGQKTYNGVATISLKPVDIITTSLADYPDPQKRVLGVLANGICVLNLYVPNGSEVDSEKYRYKLQWLSHLQAYTRTIMENFRYCILLGDFNIAPANEDVHDPEEWAGKILCSDKERQAFFYLTDAGLKDCFRLFNQEKNSFSWWDYRAAAFRRNRGLRIDHILATESLAKHCLDCQIDKAPRSHERPSDHAPVVAEFDI
jgi:exodeoxyribonuclease III